MATKKRIIVRTSKGSKWFKWWESDGDLKEDSAGTIGRARSLEDAIALAKNHAGGSNQKVEVKDL